MKKRVECIGSSPDPTQSTYVFTSTTPEGWENEIIALTYSRVANRIFNGTATSAELVHFLKMGSERERLEREEKETDMRLKQAKTTAIEEGRSMEELAKNAIDAMKSYAYISSMEEG